MTHEEFKVRQGIKFWNIVFTGVFLIANLVLAWLLYSFEWYVQEIGFADVLIITLAIWRLIRLFVYDNVMLFLREFFMDIEKTDSAVRFVDSKSSLKRTIAKLLGCPWCISVWLATGVVYAYIFIPVLYIFFLVLALSAVASLLQIFSNFIGWSAELKKVQATKN